jgi:hypothetical protein
MLTRRALVALAVLVLGAGCSKTGDVDFTITKHYTNVNSAGGAFPPTVQHVNLSTDAGEAWGHRDKVKSLDLVGIDATVVRINSGGPATANGTITFVRNTSRATVGSWANETISAAPHSVSVVLSSGAMSIVNEALHDDGKFDVEFAGSTAGAINFDADVSMHMKLTYKISLP